MPDGLRVYRSFLPSGALESEELSLGPDLLSRTTFRYAGFPPPLDQGGVQAQGRLEAGHRVRCSGPRRTGSSHDSIRPCGNLAVRLG
ncbi:MAG: hypothetical protein MZU97_12215 [Bacillus subtilis]|nr:hypothetical protein [Bacillus subtilis]